VGIARWVGILLAGGLAVAMLVLARGFGPYADLGSTAARGSLSIAFFAGGMGALSLSPAPSHDAASDGLSALALLRGYSPAALRTAGVWAILQLLFELIVLPVAFVDLVALGLGSLRGTTHGVPLGCTLFAILAAVLLGALAAASRKWGRQRGRTLFLALMVLPSLLGGALPEGWGARLSLPSLLEAAWTTLTGGTA
jgi:hypothetical protein